MSSVGSNNNGSVQSDIMLFLQAVMKFASAQSLVCQFAG